MDDLDIIEKPVEKRKTLKERLSLITYMELALTLFGVAVIILVLCIVLSCIQKGEAGLILGVLGILGLLFALAGILVTLYGHFIVRIDGKLKWTIGIITNGAVFVFFIVMYIIGAAL